MKYQLVIFSLLIVPVLFVIISCSSQDNRRKKEKLSPKELEDKFVEMNRYLVKKDSERIESYIDRRQWEMNRTESGLWYQIYDSGSGPAVKKGNIIRYNYTVELLDGTVCYTSDSLGPKQFKVGKGGVENGLELGVLHLREGDKARFIMPPFQAHGLLGDREKIPPHSSIMYQVELLQVKKR